MIRLAAVTCLIVAGIALGYRGLSAQAGTEAGQVVALDSLTVDILRSSLSSLRAPFSVGQADETDLRLGKAGIFLEEALDGILGVQVQNRYNFAVGERLAVRGFGSRAQFGIRGVKILVDGIPATMPDGQSTLDHLDLGTVGRAEILRGPGSSLYGNASGGVLTFRTRAPAPQGGRPEVRAVTGSDGLFDLEASVSGTAGETGYIVSLNRMEYDGFRDDPTRPGETYGAADRVRFNGQLTRAVAGGALRVTINVLDQDSENPGSLNAADFADGRSARGFNVLQRTGEEVTLAQAGATWEGPVAGGDAEVAVWGLTRSVLNPIPNTVIDLDRGAGGVRALFRREVSQASGLTLGGGLEIELQDDDRLNFDNDGGEKGELTLDQNENVRTTGVFLSAALPLGEKVEVSTALRYDRARFEADDELIVEGNPDDSGTRTMDAFSPSVAVSAALSPTVTLWANLATSLETPTTTELVNRPDGSGGFNPELDPQSAVGLEAGLRGVQGPLTYELTAFRVDIDDELVSFEVPEQEGRSFFRNAGSSEHKGVEAQLEVDLGSGLGAKLAFTRVDARYEVFSEGDDDFAGNRIPGLAPNRLDGSLSQVSDRWFWAIDTEWADAVPVDDPNSASADSYRLVDLRAGLRSVAVGGLEWSPYVGVSNLFDEHYSASITVNAFGNRFFEPGPERTAYVGATVAWSR